MDSIFEFAGNFTLPSLPTLASDAPLFDWDLFVTACVATWDAIKLWGLVIYPIIVYIFQFIGFLLQVIMPYIVILWEHIQEGAIWLWPHIKWAANGMYRAFLISSFML